MVALCNIFKHIPPETPNRMDTIFEYAESMNVGRQDDRNANFTQEVTLDIPDASLEPETTRFSLNKNVLLSMSQNFSILNEAKVKTQNDNYPLIFLPSKLRCCSKFLNILNVYAGIHVYTQNGVRQGRLYHAKCRVCKTSHYHGYSIDKSLNEVQFADHDNAEYIFFQFKYWLFKKINELC